MTRKEILAAAEKCEPKKRLNLFTCSKPKMRSWRPPGKGESGGSHEAGALDCH